MGRPRYVFPRDDCALLPVPNTTVEMLAQYLAGRVRKELAASDGVDVTAGEAEIEGIPGEAGAHRGDSGGGRPTGALSPPPPRPPTTAPLTRQPRAPRGPRPPRAAAR